MSNKRINDLPSETDPASTDVVALDGATTRQTTRANFLKENLEAIRGLTSAADKGIQFTGAGTAAVYDLTSAGKALLDDADAAAQRTTLGIVIGTDVQAYDASLADVSGITFAQGDVLYHNGTNLVALGPGTSGSFLKTFGAGANPAWASVPGGGSIVSVTDYGAMGDGTTDDTAAIQAAIDACVVTGARLHIPSVTAGLFYKLTDELLVTAAIIIEGDGWAPYTTAPTGGAGAVPGAGSWLKQTNDAKAVFRVARNGVTQTNGVFIRDLATMREQPAPSGGWAPTTQEYDFRFESVTDCKLSNVFILNSHKGVKVTGTIALPGGRIDIDGLFGQPMYMGVDCDFAVDVCRWNNIHFWPYWSDDANVLSWQRDNAIFFRSGRNDNMQGMNWFGYAYGVGLLFQEGPTGGAGVTSRMKLTTVEFDGTRRAVHIASTASASTAQIVNFSAACDPTLTTADAFISEATNVEFDWTNVRISNSQAYGVYATGSGSIHRFTGLWLNDWNLSGSGFPGVYADTGAAIYAYDLKTDGGSGAALVGGAGGIRGQWVSFTPVVSSGSGTITTASATGRYRRVGNTVDIFIQATITTNGTGATSVNATLPFVAAYDAVFLGREKAVVGLSVTGQILSGAASIVLKKTADELYPGGDGRVFDVSGTYEI